VARGRAAGGGRRIALARPGVTGPFRRAIVVVCDGLGVGAAPDAAAFGDEGSDTLGHVLASRPVAIPHLTALGLGNLTPTFDGARHPRPAGAYGKMAERSAGKDTATGHWEMTGVVTTTPFRVYLEGFPPAIVEPFERRIGRKVIGNKAASGTEILKELGEEHLRTGAVILYTSGDSVFQIAAHEDVVPIEELYAMCRVGYEIACLQHGVCRVIARPFVGRTAADFKRTPNRRDFPVPPTGETLVDRLADAGWPVFGVGKIEDIFSGRGISGAVHTKSDADGIDQTLKAMAAVDRGLIFTNLVDFDTLYGHRNDVPGYARNLELVDARLPEVFARMKDDDVFILTADHGCDPSDVSTDHTRENVPLLVRGAKVGAGIDLGHRKSFADLGATLAENFGVSPLAAGESFLGLLRDGAPR
jgi:phosphopentomutase